MKIRELLLLDHVYAAIEHDGAPANFHDDAAPADVLAGAEGYHFYRHIYLIKLMSLFFSIVIYKLRSFEIGPQLTINQF